MAKVGKFYLPIYSMNFIYFIGIPKKEVQSFCQKKMGYSFELGNERGRCVLLEGDNVAMCLIYVASPKDYVAMAHECLHAANFTLQSVGIDISTDNDEVQTYLLDSIFEQALNTVKK